MLKTIIWKEIREVLPLVAVALLIQIYLVCVATGTNLGQLAWVLHVLMPTSSSVIPFVSDFYCVAILVVTGLLAVVLGLWQTVGELNRGTFQFLFHRPIQRNAILATKLLVGTAACLLVAGSAVLYYALWAATPGTNASPFYWSMTTNTWIICLQMPLLYFGAFLSGLRGTGWFGSRCFPLFASLALLVVLLLSQEIMVWLVCGWLILLLFALAFDCSFVLAIVHVGRTRDFS